ncbi:hypothetical protein G6F60_013760 [Rhizopus arrhizus]|nr:hypothetical protein G6F60_013760 [Rhizopus arrhizus]
MLLDGADVLVDQLPHRAPVARPIGTGLRRLQAVAHVTEFAGQAAAGPRHRRPAAPRGHPARHPPPRARVPAAQGQYRGRGGGRAGPSWSKSWGWQGLVPAYRRGRRRLERLGWATGCRSGGSDARDAAGGDRPGRRAGPADAAGRPALPRRGRPFPAGADPGPPEAVRPAAAVRRPAGGARLGAGGCGDLRAGQHDGPGGQP